MTGCTSACLQLIGTKFYEKYLKTFAIYKIFSCLLLYTSNISEARKNQENVSNG